MKFLIKVLMIPLLIANVAAMADSHTRTEATAPAVETPGQILEGLYNYYADAALFKDCRDGKTYPVAMAGDNIALERRYLDSKSADNATVWIRVKGQLLVQAAMEGDKLETALRVNEFIDMDADRSCTDNSEPSLGGTAWHLIEVVWSEVPGDTPLEKAELNFSTEGGLTGSTGCNRLNGSYTRKDNSLLFGPIMTTRRACPDSLGALEMAVEAGLSKVNGFDISGGVLHLLQDGVPLLRYKPQ